MNFRLSQWSNLSEVAKECVFAESPRPVSDRSTRTATLAAMGATLYLPAGRPCLDRDLLKLASAGLTSAIVDLEDSVRDDAHAGARANVVDLMATLGRAWVGSPPPMALFVRVRDVTDLRLLLDRANLGVLAGFVVPKCDGRRLRAYADVLAGHEGGAGLMLMPVVETVEFARATTRTAALDNLAGAILDHQAQVLAVRFGAVDLAGAYGLRLEAGMSVHDVPLLASVVGDLVSVVSAAPVSVPVVGSVHEYYRDAPGTVDTLNGGSRARLPGLAREVRLDRATGLWGKSVVHPTQALLVNALGPVAWSDHQDATRIVAAQQGGVMASHDGSRMNEARPHHGWAAATLVRASACGVLRPGVGASDVLDLAVAAPASAGSELRLT